VQTIHHIWNSKLKPCIYDRLIGTYCFRKNDTFCTADLFEEPDERDHDDGGKYAEGERLEEGAQVEHHRQQHQGRHQAGQQ
jgi:hypothetical protein